ncbi:MAG TPA: polymer-forming cytoskeletal protein [Terriglobia bacterium]|nr:polymer-forming cytoskeletal protein [Terriglobia bacterium]
MQLSHRKPQPLTELSDLGRQEIIGLLEPGIEVEGKIKLSSGALRLNSHFKGEIEGDGVVVVAEQGEVDASIQVKAISVTGKVKGSIHASDRIEINQHGVVLGDIFTPVLVVEPGGYFDGICHMPTPGPGETTTNEVDRSERRQ